MELQIQNLTRKYGDRTAVDHINLSLTGGVYGLLGANGAGKTTLMRLICGLQKPTEGCILLNGKEITQLGERYRNLLGYLPQSISFYEEFSAEEFLRYVASVKGLEGKTAGVRCRELLKATGLFPERKRKIKTFSGGMKQRLGITQAMLNHPRILILDEPTTGLDPKERIRFRTLLRSFSGNSIVLLSTHILSDVERTADTILMMDKGRLVHVGRSEEFAAKKQGDPSLEELYLQYFGEEKEV